MLIQNNKITLALQRSKPSFFKKSKEKGIVVSAMAEWWQVLTIVTAILSIASIFLAVNQPSSASYQDEFRLIDQTKASIYLIYLDSNRSDGGEIDLISKPETATLCEGQYHSDFQIQKIENQTDHTRQLEQKLQILESEVAAKLQLLNKQININSLFNRANTYLVEKRLYYEKEYLLAQKKDAIYFSLSQICQGSEQAEMELTKISQNLEEISNLGLVDANNLTKINTSVNLWKQDLESTDFKQLFLETDEVDNLISNLDKIDNFYQEYFVSKTQLQTEFASLEKLQTDFMQKNPEMQQELILINDFSNVSTK